MAAEELGAPARLTPISREAVQHAGLNPRDVSPFSSPWMSRLDPSGAFTELGMWHTPLREYLGRIVASFLSHPPLKPPEG